MKRLFRNLGQTSPAVVAIVSTVLFLIPIGILVTGLYAIVRDYGRREKLRELNAPMTETIKYQQNEDYRVPLMPDTPIEISEAFDREYLESGFNI